MPDTDVSPVDVLYNPELGECSNELCTTFKNPNGSGQLCPVCVIEGVDREGLGKTPEDYADDFMEQTSFVPEYVDSDFCDVEILKSEFNFLLSCFDCGTEWRHTNHPDCDTPMVVPDEYLVCPDCSSEGVMCYEEVVEDE